MVIVTAGHQGKGTGASYNGFDEATEARKLTDDVVNHLKKWYKLDVRTDAPLDPLRQVIAWIKSIVKSKNDLSIEIHFNAGPPSAKGVETFIPEINTPEERELATRLSKTIANTLGTTLRTGKLKIPGVKVESESQHPRIGILSTPHLATNLLVEVCFLTNLQEIASYRKNYFLLVKNISDTIGNYCKEKGL